MLVSTVGLVPSGTLGILMAGARLVVAGEGGGEDKTRRKNEGYPLTTPATAGFPFPYNSTLSTHATKSQVFDTPCVRSLIMGF